MEKKLLFGFFVFGMSFFSLSSTNLLQAKQEMKAVLTARDTTVTISSNGFDRASDLDRWQVETTNRDKTWQTG
ncbi:MAG: hypothetical protein ACRCSQ_02850, partial [Bacteroidales bacterium]